MHDDEGGLENLAGRHIAYHNGSAAAEQAVKLSKTLMGQILTADQFLLNSTTPSEDSLRRDKNLFSPLQENLAYNECAIEHY